MTKRHFEAIAKILKSAREDAIAIGETPLQTSDVALGMADYFANENPRFDRARFLTACGL
jgi:hypothetical protein